MACASSGCVVADPPEYGQTEKIPPVLITDQAVPSPTELMFKQPEEGTSVTVPFRSEDAGEQVVSVAWLNYSIKDEEQQVGFDVDSPGTFDQVRTVGFEWKAPSREGCYPLTLLVMQQSDLDNDEKKPVATAEFGQITWWAIVGDPEQVRCTQGGGSQ